jgi:hypothetical protein
MKEYIVLKSLSLNLSVLVYFKDKDYNIHHREGDKPARIWSDGGKDYFKNDTLYKATYRLTSNRYI